MFRGFGHFRKRGLRPWILRILRRSPKSGMEIIDQIEDMTQGWWRPSPGSVYPMLDEMVKDGLIKRREDDKYELTSKTRDDDEWPFGSHFAAPRSIDEMLTEIGGYISYFEDMAKTDKSKLESYSNEMQKLSDRLSAMAK